VSDDPEILAVNHGDGEASALINVPDGSEAAERLRAVTRVGADGVSVRVTLQEGEYVLPVAEIADMHLTFERLPEKPPSLVAIWPSTLYRCHVLTARQRRMSLVRMDEPAMVLLAAGGA